METSQSVTSICTPASSRLSQVSRYSRRSTSVFAESRQPIVAKQSCRSLSSTVAYSAPKLLTYRRASHGKRLRRSKAGQDLHAWAGAITQSWRLREGCEQKRPTQVGASRVGLEPVLGDLAEGLETPVQAIYLVTLLGFLVVGAYLVVRQVLIRRELEEAAKVLGDRIRTGSAASEDFFELGVILLRKKLFTQAVKNLEKAKKAWDGEPDELAQVHNALGFAYFNMEKAGMAIDNYRKAVELQPGYVTAWNNLGDAYEKARDWKGAYGAYNEALSYAPDNRIARERADSLRGRAQGVGN